MTQLSHTPSKILQALLVELGLGGDIVAPGNSQPAWPIYYSVLPSAPDNAICVYDTLGRKQSRTQLTGESNEFQGIQIKVRSQDVDEGAKKAQDLAYALDQVILNNTITLDTDTYFVQEFSRTSPVLSLGVESPTTNRRLFSINGLLNVIMNNPGTGT